MSEYPYGRVLVCTADDSLFNQCIGLGVDGYVLKRDPFTSISLFAAKPGSIKRDVKSDAMHSAFLKYGRTFFFSPFLGRLLPFNNKHPP